MNQLEKEFQQPGDRKGAAGRRAAKAAGIAPDTWTRWKNNQRTPSAGSLRKLEGAYARFVQLPKFRRRVNATNAPNRVRVTAVINWNGYVNRTAQRSTTLENMRAVMVRVIRAWAMAGPEAAADAFQQGVASAHNTNFVLFEGDRVEIEFP